jgi:hypothetical protein
MSKVERPGTQHPFAADLDLIGDRSLHQLLNTAISSEGSQRLADWLTLTYPNKDVILQRQQLVRDLMPLTHFRDRLALNARLSTDSHSGAWQSSKVLSSLAPMGDPGPLRRVLVVMALLSAVAIALFLLDWLRPSAPLWAIPWLMYVVLFIVNASKIRSLFESAFEAHSALQRLRRVFECLERHDYEETPALKSLCAPFREPGRRPSSLLRRVTRVLAGASLQGNIYLWLPVNLIIPWDFFFAYRLRLLQSELAQWLPKWLDTWYELEALCSLANYGYLNPTTTFPIFSGHDQGRRSPFRVAAIGHPLIAEDIRVCNDFEISAIGEVALITGSNMSGKSSFLRTLGVNLCLAFSGSPVCAAAMETRVFRLFTSITLSDSVVDGISYFYAEVRRLKRLLDELQRVDEVPLFFLIDEIFRGTNNRERLIGSRAYVRAMAGHNGVGVISTHDLELTKLPDEVSRLVNYHFKEHLAGDKMVFDYQLRPGPSPSTNALRIMQLEGLPIEAAADTSTSG